MSLDEPTRERIQSLIDGSDVFLFMKGQPEAPQCGFSATVVGILDQLIPAYESFDVLSDQAIREGVKEFSSWPTIPQLYVKGELVGGCDIVQETYASGELHDTLGVAKAEASDPGLTITESAAEALRGATSQAGPGQELRLSVDARFRSRMVLAPADDEDVVVESGGIGLRLDPLSAARAKNATIDVVQTKRGPAFQVQLPEAPESAA